MENNLEEERRLCYVAITRARKMVWLVNAKRRLLYGETKENPVSRFIKEIDKNYLDIDKVNQEFNKEDQYTDAEYVIGEHIIHDTYGEGIIVNIKDKILTVAFPSPDGLKTLMKGHKSIKKVNE